MPKVVQCPVAILLFRARPARIALGLSALGVALAGCFAPDGGMLTAQTEASTSGSPSTTDLSMSGASDPGSSTMADATVDDTGISDLCGNGEIDPGEECDLAGNNSDSAGCTSDCQLAVCGDGLLYIGREECDDTNDDNTDACLNSCVEASCGDGFVWAGNEQCDTRVENGSCDGCRTSCAAGYDDCDGDGTSCEVQLCGGTCAQPGPPPGPAEFAVTGLAETFTVPECVEVVTIEAWGAQGGDNIELVDLGGLGARMRGDFTVIPGEELSIVVGERGFNAPNGNLANGAGGGGGGSFVWRSGGADPMIVAGGGGGSSLTNDGEPHFWGKDGVVGEDGTGSRSHDANGDAPGGTGGGDGKAICGAGGNGWLTVMADPSGQAGCGTYGGGGGFGGGGGGGCPPNTCNLIHTAGGGGGYSGGGAGGSCYLFGGGGGGSFNAGDNQDNSDGANMGDGRVTISW